MTPTTVTLKHKNKVTTWTETVTVSRKPATLSRYRAATPSGRPGERERARWFQYVADHITECFEVTTVTQCGEYSQPRTETFFEFVTPFGRGVIVDYQGGGEIAVFIPTTGKALLCGFWSKRGHKVGHARAYAVGMGLNPDSRKVEHTCPARMYDTARGQSARWGAS